MDKNSKWILCDEGLPQIDTPVLAVVHGMDFPIVLEMRMEFPTYEETFKPFRYWDDPSNDGQDYADRVCAWQSLPEMPTMENNNE